MSLHGFKRRSGRLWRMVACVAMMMLPLLARGGLVWEARELKVEANANEKEIVAQYRFKNASNAPVAIREIVSSCDCTTAEPSQRVYAAGEEGTLTARLAVGEQSGWQENTFVVTTDDAPDEPVQLRLRVNIRSLVALSAPVLSWRVGAESEEHETLVTAASPLRIASLAITGTYPAGAAKAGVETIPNGAQYRVWVRPRSLAHTMNLTLSCLATFADGTTQTFVIYGVARK